MKKALFILFIVFLIPSCTVKVIDLAQISSLVLIHQKQQPQYKGIKKNEYINTALERLVRKTTDENREITEKIKKRYTDVTMLLTTIPKLPYALDVIKDIKKYQKLSVEIVSDNPKLVVIALKTEVEILKKVNRLYKYIYANAIIGTDINRIPIAERLEIVDYVIRELKIIRGYSYGLHRKLRMAKYSGDLTAILKEFNIEGIDNATRRIIMKKAIKHLKK